MIKYKHTNLIIGAVTALLFLALYNISTFAYNCQAIRNDTIRLHVVANSDSEADQELKLKVRDAILQQCPGIFDGTITAEDAKAKILAETENLKATAQKTIAENGFEYSVNVALTTEYFSTRVYENNVTLPAGKYLALKIVIGNGTGKNWWCIMFPSLCLPAAEKNNEDSINNVFNQQEKSIIFESEKYEIRFRIVEYTELIKKYLGTKSE